MNKQRTTETEKNAFGLSLKDIKEVIGSHTKEDLRTIFQKIEKESKKIRAREDIYVERVPEELMKKHFEIVR